MIDIHSHIVFDVDDGSRSLESSLQMAQEALEIGITAIIATPHFAYQSGDKQRVIENFNILKSKTDQMGLELYLGSELMSTPMIAEAIDSSIQIGTSNKRFQLIEFPNHAFHLYLFDMIYQMQLQKITPIIAHPERNVYFQRNYSVLCDLADKGCYLQIDAESFMREHIFSRKLAKKLVAERRADFISFDVHNSGEYKKFYAPAKKCVEKWADEKYANELFAENAKKLLAAYNTSN